MKIAYIDKSFREDTLEIIALAEMIIDELGIQGFYLTLRQLYYQMVARGYIENSLRSYKRLGNIINDARMTGLISWEAIEDRTRNLRGRTRWSRPSQIMRGAVDGFHVDMWEGQEYRPEVWVEKDALISVVQQACDPLDVRYLSCRGYVSASEMWSAGHDRLRDIIENGQEPIILHLGDHDPSGIDMTRDIRERLSLFAEYAITVKRIALNMDQIEQYDPPPNPAKITDSRSDAYIAQYGNDSWELDALSPQVIVDLIEGEVWSYVDDDLWDDTHEKEERGREILKTMLDDVKAKEKASGEWDS